MNNLSRQKSTQTVLDFNKPKESPTNENIREYLGKRIPFEERNGMLMANATVMAKEHGKNVKDIMKSKAWKDVVDFTLEMINSKRKDNSPITSKQVANLQLELKDIVIIKKGNNGEEQGTWIHEKLVVEFARRLDFKFAVWCNETIEDLLKNGKVEIKVSKTPIQLLEIKEEEYLERPIQVMLAKAVNNRLGTEKTEYHVIMHNVNNCKIITGHKPSEVKAHYKSIYNVDKPAKEWVRIHNPPMGAAMAFLDEFAAKGGMLSAFDKKGDMIVGAFKAVYELKLFSQKAMGVLPKNNQSNTLNK
jgi:hypothetical protein